MNKKVIVIMLSLTLSNMATAKTTPSMVGTALKDGFNSVSSVVSTGVNGAYSVVSIGVNTVLHAATAPFTISVVVSALTGYASGALVSSAREASWPVRLGAYTIAFIVEPAFKWGFVNSLEKQEGLNKKDAGAWNTAVFITNWLAYLTR